MFQSVPLYVDARKVQKAVEEVISALQQCLPSAPGSSTPGAGRTEGLSVLSYLPSLLESVLTALIPHAMPRVS
jgi:hypothetical protein